MQPRRALPLLVLALLVAAGPVAAASERPLFVGLVIVEAREGGAWTVTETVVFAPRNASPVAAGDAVDLWVPAEATLHRVSVDGNQTLWFRENASAVRVPLDGPVREVVAQFTVAGPRAVAVPLVGTHGRIEVWTLPGHEPDAPGLRFVNTGTVTAGREVWVADIPEGSAWTAWPLSVGAPETPGPEPVGWPFALASVVALALLAALYVARRRGLHASTGEMSLMGHLRELTMRLTTMVIAVVFFLVAFFTFGLQSSVLYGYRVWYPVFSIAGSIGIQAFNVVAERFIPAGVTLIVTGPADAILAQFEVTLLLAILAALPVIAYEVGAFIAPALLKEEKEYVWRIAPAVVMLFLAGAAFAFFLMIPFMLGTLYEYAGHIGAVPFITAASLVGFTVWTTLLFGLAFELPVIMAALTAFGLVKPETYLSKWRHAVVVIFILSGIVTPDPTVVSQLLVALPMLLLYLGGAFVARGIAKRRERAGA